MTSDALKIQAQQLIIFSMDFLKSAYQDQMKQSGGHMALIVAASALDGFLDEIDAAPSVPLTLAEKREQVRKIREISEKIQAFLANMDPSDFSASE